MRCINVYMKQYDVIIIGAGAAGLSAARTAIARGRRVVVLDMGAAPARKVMASGGGRCNFTNTAATSDRYFGQNPEFVRGALARVSPDDILKWMQNHNLEYVEKAPGQYFCASGAADVVDALTHDANGAKIVLNATVLNISKRDDTFIIQTQNDLYTGKSVIVATGGISFPTLVVSDLGYKIAKQFGHKIVPVRPALCAIATNAFSPELAGISIPVEIRIGRARINDSLLFTHFGIGGPAVYRATVRDIGDDICINLLPRIDVYEFLRNAKRTDGRKSLQNILAAELPLRLARWIAGTDVKNIADYKDTELKNIANRICNIIIPRAAIKLHGMPSAEVVRGGVATVDVSSKTMESKFCTGLYFAGEVLDIAGDLGGFNLQWAWASGIVAGMNA